MSPMLQMRKLRLGEVMSLAQQAQQYEAGLGFERGPAWPFFWCAWPPALSIGCAELEGVTGSPGDPVQCLSTSPAPPQSTVSAASLRDKG